MAEPGHDARARRPQPQQYVARDYRFSVLQCVESAVEWLILPEDRRNMRWLWEMQLERAMQAYFELDCEALL